MCADKNKFLDSILVVIMLIGVFMLVDLYFIHTSSYVNAAISAILCGIVAPAFQSIRIFTQNQNKKLISLSLILIIMTFFLILLGEYLTTEILHLKIVKYLYYPGRLINTVLTIVGTIFVILVTIRLQKDNV